MQKPIIGITAGNLKFHDTKRTFVNQNDIQAIINAGGIPVLLPPQVKDELDRYIKICDGFYFPGGPDVSPFYFKEEPTVGLSFVERARDRLEIELIKKAVAAGKTLLGVCRGMQVINIALGGDVYQDLTKQFVEPQKLFQHAQKGDINEASHHIKITAGTHLAKIFAEQTLAVNSHHHQAVRRVAAGLRVAARAADGVIEAVESENSPQILAVQWHPEFLVETIPTMQSIFDDFILRIPVKSN
ncbi:gamma-glutamyl-gamma-aminobutyrate hydrolase family protein [Liquorilactobacillus sicerae]|uniref:gamma-glutamyl-gamma-aminobutyrate hydrolase family protein n=1 Tax=Liquorilactobacillus sicerae TaxID=1416943 RepID=UPI00248038DD|nr:gamma-glutamyl-gamma-aminobutyrate hydrolase family protein [Liquorilactobacillus sicerae]